METNLIQGEPYTEKGSKFFGFFCRIKSAEDFKSVMKTIKKEHKKASHYCFAYIVNEPAETITEPANSAQISPFDSNKPHLSKDILPLADNNKSLFSDNGKPRLFEENKVRKEKYSNDGEPSGCGSALLNLLKYGRFENCALIVVRYFGGVLLGSGNLIRAYAAAGKSALSKIPAENTV